MKHLKFLAAVCCMAAVFTACEKNEPSNNATGTANGHGYVDLGLPSGLKWATCNVGANKPEEYGDYYAWGETEPKTTYDESTYKWWDSSYRTLTKYCTDSDCGTVDNKTVLDLEDDAARANWGGAWRMPTDAEWTELRENCTWKWTTRNGINGYEVKGSNGNSIFLPAAGGRGSDELYGYCGYYWSSSLYTDYPWIAWGVEFYSEGGVYRAYDIGIRCFGFSVRAVCE